MCSLFHTTLSTYGYKVVVVCTNEGLSLARVRETVTLFTFTGEETAALKVEFATRKVLLLKQNLNSTLSDSRGTGVKVKNKNPLENIDKI